VAIAGDLFVLEISSQGQGRGENHLVTKKKLPSWSVHFSSWVLEYVKVSTARKSVEKETSNLVVEPA
jgi:hypothetical protein